MRSDGFDRMDVSTSVDDDPKFRLLARRHPNEFEAAFCGYIGLMARSWREGERLTAEEGWPALVPYELETADALRDVRLLDDEYRIPSRAWDAWFGSAAERRRLGRERQHRADKRRGRVKSSAEDPTGSQGSQDSQTGSTDSPSGSQSGSQSGPTPVQRGSSAGADDQPWNKPRQGIVPNQGPCRDCGGYLTDREPCRVGPGWIEHAEHPERGAA